MQEKRHDVLLLWPSHSFASGPKNALKTRGGRPFHSCCFFQLYRTGKIYLLIREKNLLSLISVNSLNRINVSSALNTSKFFELDLISMYIHEYNHNFIQGLSVVSFMLFIFNFDTHFTCCSCCTAAPLFNVFVPQFPGYSQQRLTS